MLMLQRHTLLTKGFAPPQWHIARASSSPMLSNTVPTRNQLGMVEPGFETHGPVVGYLLSLRTVFLAA